MLLVANEEQKANVLVDSKETLNYLNPLVTANSHKQTGIIE